MLTITKQGMMIVNCNKTKALSILLTTIFALNFTTAIYAEDDPSSACASAVSLYKDGDFEGALEDAKWCVTQLEQLKQSKVSSFFKDEINGYKGGEIQQQQAMGFSMVERSYSKNGKIIKVLLSGGASGAGNNAFAALASLGMNSAKGKKVRIQRRTGFISTKNKKTELVVTLKSGGMLTLESRDVSPDGIMAFIKKFPVAELDDSRK